jgi:hypothetical protein
MAKKLTAKKLDQLIADVYQVAAQGKTINILDIGKVYEAARNTYARTGDVEAMALTVYGAVATYCKAA